MSEEPVDHEGVTLIEYVKARLDGQDHVLARIAEDVLATRRQATKTNGRVTALERKSEIQEALQEAQQKNADERIVGQRWRVNLYAGGAFLVAGAIFGQIAHLIHIG